MEELLPLVKELADIYTGKESTSISYEAAQRLMEAVLYCIRENDRPWNEEGNAVATRSLFATAREAYDQGYGLVVEKTRKANEMFNDLITDFQAYGNRAYYETVVEGMPEFFRWYDPRLNPMNHILTVDYPLLEPLQELEGIDLIYRFLVCVQKEQVFLHRFPESYIRRVLVSFHSDYEELIINICGLVLRRVLVNMLIGKGIDKDHYEPADYEKLASLINSRTREELQEDLSFQLERLIREIYSGDRGLFAYLAKELPNIAAELRNAANNHCLNQVI
jgi:hypothetical protein